MQGLGKTVQVIALLTHLVESQSISGPFLIVSPSSVLSNWEAELCTWAPGLLTVLYQGNVAERKALLAKHVSQQLSGLHRSLVPLACRHPCEKGICMVVNAAETCVPWQ